jgi:threonyl-tRNA synthetase
VQVVVLPITDRQNEYSREVQQRLVNAGVRTELDDRSEKVNLKIREAQLQKVPYMLVVGDREAQSGQVSVRHRKHGDQGAQTLDAFLEMIGEQIEKKIIEE